MAWLRILSGRGEGSTYDIGERTFTLGRSPGNFVQLLSDDVSRRHCQFRWEAGRCVVQDLNSQNGIAVNGERIVQRTLADGDRIAIGRTVLQFRTLPELPGAEDHARRWKEIRAEITGGSTTSLRQDDLSGLLGALRANLIDEGLAGRDGEFLPDDGTAPAPGPGSIADGEAHRLLERLATAPAGTTTATFLGELASGAGRVSNACRVCVLLRRTDASGAARLAPVLTWSRPDLPATLRGRPLLAAVLRRAMSESAAVGLAGTGPDDPTVALAVPLAASTTWHGLVYADSFLPAPGPFAQTHLAFLAALSARASAFLAARGT